MYCWRNYAICKTCNISGNVHVFIAAYLVIHSLALSLSLSQEGAQRIFTAGRRSVGAVAAEWAVPPATAPTVPPPSLLTTMAPASEAAGEEPRRRISRGSNKRPPKAWRFSRNFRVIMLVTKKEPTIKVLVTNLFSFPYGIAICILFFFLWEKE